jgi:F-type H+-transporting ATPase subunit alpha
MRSVAGRLRLDLAQYRELEAFAAFASDLDAATKRQLERGARTVEVLKQPQYSPVPVEQQVVIIYAVTNGHIDEVPVNRVREWERQFQEYLTARHPNIGEKLRTEKALSKETEAELKSAIASFKHTFK